MVDTGITFAFLVSLSIYTSPTNFHNMAEDATEQMTEIQEKQATTRNEKSVSSLDFSTKASDDVEISDNAEELFPPESTCATTKPSAIDSSTG